MELNGFIILLFLKIGQYSQQKKSSHNMPEKINLYPYTNYAL